MPVLEVDHLHKRYGDTVAVDDVSFAVEEGEIFGILGPNGAGKTTTVECLEGLRRPDRGTLRVFGRDPQRDHAALTEVVGVQLQESQLNDKIRVGEAMALFATFYDDPADGTSLLRELGIADTVRTPYRKLSGGQKQRLSIALALLGRPRLAVLDELTTGLDPAARRETWSLIERLRDRGVTILLVTHFMDEAQRLCDRVAIIDHGRVVALDTPARLATRVRSAQVMRFRLERPVALERMRAVPEVTDVRLEGETYVVTGTSAALQGVIAVLVRSGEVALDLRMDGSNLEDAFVALTSDADPSLA